MGIKADREWATRSEACRIIATLPANATAMDLACALFNSKPDNINKSVVTERTKLAAAIRAKREAEDKILAAAQQSSQQSPQQPAQASAGKTGTTGK